MSRKLLVFLLSELDKVRILCKGCQCVSELALADLQKHAVRSCPFCNAAFNPSTTADVLRDFAAVLDKARGHGQLFDVEFVVPDKGQ